MQKSRDNNWHLFTNVLGKKEFAKLELAGINYRLPTVGAVIEQGILKANIAFPGLTIEYQLQGDNVDDKPWLTYTKPVVVDTAVFIRSRSINGLRTGRITKVPVH